MNRIEGHTVALELLERIPERGSGATFLAMVKMPVAEGQVKEDSGLGDGQENHDAQVSPVPSHESHVVSTTAELYGMGRYALHKLSYEAGNTDLGLSALVVNASPAPCMASKVTVIRSEATGSPVAFDVADQGVEPVRLEAGSKLRGVDACETVPEALGRIGAEFCGLRHPRRLQLLPADDGVEAVIRDYNLENKAELVAQLQEHCRLRGIKLARIVLNGTLLWSA